MESNNKAFDNALKTIIAVLGHSHPSQCVEAVDESSGRQHGPGLESGDSGTRRNRPAARLSRTSRRARAGPFHIKGTRGGIADTEVEDEEEEGQERMESPITSESLSLDDNAVPMGVRSIFVNDNLEVEEQQGGPYASSARRRSSYPTRLRTRMAPLRGAGGEAEDKALKSADAAQLEGSDVGIRGLSPVRVTRRASTLGRPLQRSADGRQHAEAVLPVSKKRSRLGHHSVPSRDTEAGPGGYEELGHVSGVGGEKEHPTKGGGSSPALPAASRWEVTAAVQAFLRGFERYLSLEHVSSHTGQPLAPLTVSNRVSQAHRLLFRAGLEEPTEEGLERLRVDVGPDRNAYNLAGDMLGFLQRYRWSEAGEQTGSGPAQTSVAGGGRAGEAAPERRGSRGRGGGRRGGGARGRRGLGGRGWRGKEGRGIFEPGRVEAKASEGWGGGGRRGGARVRGNASLACNGFLHWMCVEDAGLRVSNATAHAYVLVLTDMLRALGCQMSDLGGAEELRRYVLTHKREMEALIPPNRVPYPRERAAWKKVWEWASGKRIWEGEAGHHRLGLGASSSSAGSSRQQARALVSDKAESTETHSFEGEANRGLGGGQEEGDVSDEEAGMGEGEEEAEEEDKVLKDVIKWMGENNTKKRRKESKGILDEQVDDAVEETGGTGAVEEEKVGENEETREENQGLRRRTDAPKQARTDAQCFDDSNGLIRRDGEGEGVKASDWGVPRHRLLREERDSSKDYLDARASL